MGSSGPAAALRTVLGEGRAFSQAPPKRLLCSVSMVAGSTGQARRQAGVACVGGMFLKDGADR